MLKDSCQEALKISSQIDGWLTPAESVFLFNAASKIPTDTSILEIGAWKGRSTVLLGLGAMDGNRAKVFSIDPHTGSPEQKERYGKINTLSEWKSNVEKAGLGEIVTSYIMTSKEASHLPKRKIGMIFIDGDHNYDMVKLDFEIWFPKLLDGGLIAIHDTMGKIGPKKVADNLLLASKQSWKAGFVDTITYAYKKSHNNLWNRIHNQWIRIRRNISESNYNRKERKTL